MSTHGAVSNQVMLFDRNTVKELDHLDQRPGRLSRSKLLWVDVDRGSDEAVQRVAAEFELDDETRAALTRSKNGAFFRDHDRYIHVTVFAPSREDGGALSALECIVGDNWVLTAHDEPIPVLEEFTARASGSGDTGSMDGSTFLAALFDWVLGSYSDAFESIEQELERFDIGAMRGERDAEGDIERLAEMRARVGGLRRALVAHRSTIVALTYPELAALDGGGSAERFQSLLSRFESTLQEARDAREATVGSFDVLLARGGHRTNEIMKVLTLVTVILLPGALIAGVMGMNFKVSLFEQPMLFWAVLAVMVAIAFVTLGVARARRWI